MKNDIMLAAGAIILLTIAACAPLPQPGARGPSGLETPLSAEYVQIGNVEPGVVEVDASGVLLRATPPEGLCIPVDSIQTGPDAAFMIFSECPGAPSAGEGVLSVSVAAAPLMGGFASLERVFATPEGLAGLGYGGDPADISMVETWTGPRALYTVVEDRSEFGPAFAGDLICRAFTEIKGRMVVATLISRRDETHDAEGMRARLGAVVAALHAGNA